MFRHQGRQIQAPRCPQDPIDDFTVEMVGYAKALAGRQDDADAAHLRSHWCVLAGKSANPGHPNQQALIDQFAYGRAHRHVGKSIV